MSLPSDVAHQAHEPADADALQVLGLVPGPVDVGLEGVCYFSLRVRVEVSLQVSGIRLVMARPYQRVRAEGRVHHGVDEVAGQGDSFNVLPRAVERNDALCADDDEPGR